MTTLHEEPVRPHTLNEESEDCYSDPDYPEYEPTTKVSGYMSRPMKYSRTVDSFVDIGKAAMNHPPMSHQDMAKNEIPQSSSSGDTVPHGATNTSSSGAKNSSTPSMTSSTSSGYGSQAVSCSNLTNDDSFSVRSMSVDETPGMPFFIVQKSIKHSRCLLIFYNHYVWLKLAYLIDYRL